MDLILNLEIKRPDVQIGYKDHILLIGSCFTEHIGKALSELKFNTLQNPNGILFDPLSVSSSLINYIDNREFHKSDLFQNNDVWQSWQHHSRFSNINADECLAQIRAAQQEAHSFLKKADWIIITLGSAFSYSLTEEGARASDKPQSAVANCHRAPSQWFKKKYG